MKEVVERQHIVKGKCAALGCSNNSKKSKFCATCRCRISRMKDPVRYSYNNKKHRAKERNIEFTISLEYFRKFCYETEYINKTGRTVGCFDCDRIEEDKGYVEGNIQALEKVKNIQKHHNFKKQKRVDYHWWDGTCKVVTMTPPPEIPDSEKEDWF